MGLLTSAYARSNLSPVGSIPAEDAERPMYQGKIFDPTAGYDLAAHSYDGWHWQEFWKRNEVPLLTKLIDLQSAYRTALDLGCGTGTYSSILALRGKALGIDPSVHMLERAKAKYGHSAKFLKGRAAALPLETSSVDLCVAARSLCHEADLAGAMVEVSRVLQPGGLWIVSEVHSQHRYPRTRIPVGKEDVHIQTIKRSPDEIISAAESHFWKCTFRQEIFWSDLIWKPQSDFFRRIDRTDKRPIFYVVAMRHH